MRHVENKKLPVSLAREDLRDLSDVHSGLYNDVMSFHHVTKVIHFPNTSYLMFYALRCLAHIRHTHVSLVPGDSNLMT